MWRREEKRRFLGVLPCDDSRGKKEVKLLVKAIVSIVQVPIPWGVKKGSRSPFVCR
jgi:hypothetical protein